MRTPYGMMQWPRPLLTLGRLICENGYHVVLQDVRGRYESEGRFTPHANEGRDGKATLDWLAEQSWCDGRIALVGSSYPGYAAWAALAEAPERVSALVVALGARDPYASFYPGGAFSLATALEWGIGLGERERVSPGEIDLERALAYRPLREADRVALRRVDAYRHWLDHPRRDGFWEALCSTLPEHPPPCLLLAGWYDIFLAAQLSDYLALDDDARARGSIAPRLVIGPWAHGRVAHPSWRGRGTNPLGVALRETLRFLDRQLGDTPDRDGPERGEEVDTVRFYVLGAARWRNESRWPAPGVHPRSLHFRSGGAANGLRGDGSLSWDAPEEQEPADHYRYEPGDPVPSLAGRVLGRAGGATDQRPVESRLDVLCYTSAKLQEKIEIAGPVTVSLYASSSAEDADFTAKLVDVALDGTALNLCEGIARSRWSGRTAAEKEPHWLRPGEATHIEIDLGATACVFDRGHRIRVEISSSNFPHFDRNPSNRNDPATTQPEEQDGAEQIVYHDAAHPSQVVLPVL